MGKGSRKRKCASCGLPYKGNDGPKGANCKHGNMTFNDIDSDQTRGQAGSSMAATPHNVTQPTNHTALHIKQMSELSLNFNGIVDAQKHREAQVHIWIPESGFGMVHIPPAPQTIQEPQPVPATYTPLYTEPLSSLRAYDNHIAAVPDMFPAGATVKSMFDVDGISTKTISTEHSYRKYCL